MSKCTNCSYNVYRVLVPFHCHHHILINCMMCYSYTLLCSSTNICDLDHEFEPNNKVIN